MGTVVWIRILAYFPNSHNVLLDLPVVSALFRECAVRGAIQPRRRRRALKRQKTSLRSILWYITSWCSCQLARRNGWSQISLSKRWHWHGGQFPLCQIDAISGFSRLFFPDYNSFLVFKNIKTHSYTMSSQRRMVSIIIIKSFSTTTFKILRSANMIGE
jgi:hypothetical protein